MAGMSVLGAEAAKAGINFVTQVGSNAVGGLFGINQARKNRAFQERMYNKQVQDTIDFWKMQQDYNLPSAQLQRIQDAGLSGLLMYGEGGLTGNIAGQAPSLPSAPHGAQAATPSFNTRLDIANLALLGAQKENIEADTMLKHNEALKAASEKVKTLGEYEWLKDSWELRKDEIQADNELKRAYAYTEVSKRNEIEANIDKAMTEIDYIKNDIYNKNRLTDQDIKESDQRIQNSIKETAAAVKKMNAEARKAEADAFYARALGAIVNSPEYQRDSIKLKAEELRRAMSEGDQAAIEAGLSAWIYEMRPKEGSPAYEYKRWIDRWVTPVTESLGKLLGGSATYSFPTKKR